MRIRRVQRAAVFAAGLAMVAGGTALASAATAQPALVRGGHPAGVRHVLLISVDGLHQQDLAWYVRAVRLVQGAGDPERDRWL
jgi:ribosomal protein L32E